jgi:hypothetical protein
MMKKKLGEINKHEKKEGTKKFIAHCNAPLKKLSECQTSNRKTSPRSHARAQWH